MPTRSLASLVLPVYLAPALHDALHVDRCARARHREQSGLGIRSRDTCQGANLRVGELPPLQSRGHGRQRPEGAGDPDALSSGARGKPDPPCEPLGAGPKARVPATACVELADERQEAGRRRVEVGRELGDLVAQAIQLCAALWVATSWTYPMGVPA